MEPIELAPAVWQYEFPEELARNIIDVLEQAPIDIWQKSKIMGGEDESQMIRTSNGTNLDEFFPFWAKEVRELMIPAAKDYAEKTDHETTQDEGINVLRYDQGVGKYDFHADGAWSIYRQSSCLIYLNPSEYEGGETHFKHFGIKVKPEKPSIVFFPANYAYLHAALPTTKGSKYVLVTWMNDLPRGWHPSILRSLAQASGIMVP